MAKFGLFFCLYTEKYFFFKGFILKPTERAQVLLKMVVGIFKLAHSV